MLAAFGLQQAKGAERPQIRYSQRYDVCSAKAEGSYTHIIACLAEEQNTQEAALNRAYQAAMRRSSARQKLILRTSERGWLIERERRCLLPATDAGLSDWADHRLCLLDETIRRTDWLSHR